MHDAILRSKGLFFFLNISCRNNNECLIYEPSQLRTDFSFNKIPTYPVIIDIELVKNKYKLNEINRQNSEKFRTKNK